MQRKRRPRGHIAPSDARVRSVSPHTGERASVDPTATTNRQPAGKATTTLEEGLVGGLGKDACVRGREPRARAVPVRLGEEKGWATGRARDFASSALQQQRADKDGAGAFDEDGVRCAGERQCGTPGCSLRAYHDGVCEPDRLLEAAEPAEGRRLTRAQIDVGHLVDDDDDESEEGSEDAVGASVRVLARGEWWDAVVVERRGEEGEEEVKVHFPRWNTRHDECCS